MPRNSTPLETYRTKRDFARTAEPKGRVEPTRKSGRYVIQKHDARRLHFDLRLELDGVLKSWAVTRGPSLDPADKRLAVRTEDHPVAYGTFEGTIPKGEYGGGTVLLWDRGRWLPRGDAHEGLHNGLLKFDLDGERLKGGFALVRLGKKPREKRENWLLIKERDTYAQRDGEASDRWMTSVATGRDLDDIAAGRSSPAKALRSGAQRGRSRSTRTASAKRRTEKDDADSDGPHRLPAFIAPQLATLAAEPPVGEDWIHEIKYDGYRAIAVIGRGRCRMFTRSGLDWTSRFAPIDAALATLPVKSAVIDGEVVAFDENGKTDFGCLQRALDAGGSELIFFAFDLLEHNGRDLQNKPLIERKARLAELIRRPSGNVRYSDHIVGHGDQILAKACRMGLEGIVSKRADTPYLSGRTRSWLKTKCLGRDEFVIGGYRISGKKGRAFASLLLGEFDGRTLRYRGRVGTGFDERTLAELGASLSKLGRKTSPFADAPSEISRSARWVEPRLVAEIAYAERTADGILRHPSFLGLRGDKAAKDVQMKQKAKRAEKDTPQRVAGVKLTHPDKVLFAGANITKDNLAEYLLAVSDVMLPHIRGRPLSLVRCPEGTSETCFFQKHHTRGLPAALGSVPVTEGDGTRARYVAIDTPSGLVAAAQVGALELHIWGAHADTIERPDRMVFDLDPHEAVPFRDVRRAAFDLRQLLAAAGLQSFPLLTGGKGIHVIIPLQRRHDWTDVKGFAKGFATRLAENEPGRFTATMSKARRTGRIFIDWLRNERGATAIAPYSPRAKANAPVAMPVSWEELRRIERSDAFTVGLAAARVRRRGNDAWPDYFSIRQRIPKQALRFFSGD